MSENKVEIYSNDNYFYFKKTITLNSIVDNNNTNNINTKDIYNNSKKIIVLKYLLNKLTNKITFTDSLSNIELNNNNLIAKVDAIFSIKIIENNSLLICIDKSNKVYNILDNYIYKVNDIVVIPINYNKGYKYIENKLLEFYKYYLKYNNLYYSNSFRLDVLFKNTFDKSDKNTLYDMIDTDFNLNSIIPSLLNKYSNSKSTEFQYSSYIFPYLVVGYYNKVHFDFINENTTIEIQLFSRRNILNHGARYYNRGLDNNGHACNYVESELLILVKNNYNELKNYYNYCITRGSYPLLWSQPKNYPIYNKYIKVEKSLDKNLCYINAYLKSLIDKNKKIKIINLLGQNKHEEYLTNKFTKFYNIICDNSLNKSIKYNSHNINYDLNKLGLKNFYSYINDDFNYNSYSVSKDSTTVVKIKEVSQKSFIRINCLDSVDRTNKGVLMCFEYVLKNILNENKILINYNIANIFQELKILVKQQGFAICYSYCRTNCLSKQNGIINIYNDFKTKILRYLNGNYSDWYYNSVCKVINNKDTKKNYNFNKLKLIDIKFVFLLYAILMTLTYLTSNFIKLLLFKINPSNIILNLFLYFISFLFSNILINIIQMLLKGELNYIYNRC